MKNHRIAVIPGDGIGKEVVPGGPARARGRGAQVRARPRMARIRLELRLLREARAHDARGLVRDAVAVRRDLLRRRRLARDRAGPRLALGLAHPVPARLRPVREPAAVPADAGHPEPAREQASRATSISSSCARTPRANTRPSAAACSRAPTARSCSRRSVFSRKGVDRILQFAFELAGKRAAKHLTSATKSNGISITMPYWDERFRAMAARYPGIRTDQYHIDILAAHFVARPRALRRRRRLQPVRRHPVRSRPGGLRHDRHRAVGQHQSGARASRRCSSRCTVPRPTSPARASPIRSGRSGRAR